MTGASGSGKGGIPDGATGMSPRKGTFCCACPIVVPIPAAMIAAATSSRRRVTRLPRAARDAAVAGAAVGRRHGIGGEAERLERGTGHAAGEHARTRLEEHALGGRAPVE